MKRICPNPIPWNKSFERLNHFAKEHPCMPPSPPKPLILAGWAFSNDTEKMQRWEETVAWANINGCLELVKGIPENEFYFVSEPTSYTIGPFGGPMYLPWNFDSKLIPSYEEITRHFEELKLRWSEIVGLELAHITRPISFTGEKARRLLVFADSSSRPPWGGWSHLSHLETDRRTFTKFRAVINKAIVPHQVDHIDFTTDTEPIAPRNGPQATHS